TGTRMVRDVARRLAAEAVRPGASALPHAFDRNLDRRIRGRHSGRNSGYWHARRSVEYRDAVCVRAGIGGGDHPPITRSRTAPWIPRSRRHCRTCAQRAVLRAAEVRAADPDLVALLWLAGNRAGHLWHV